MSAVLLAAAGALRAALSQVDPAGWSGSECAAVAEVLAVTEKACGATRLVVSARAVESGAAREAGFADGAAWVAARSGSTRGAARRALATVEAVEACPDTRSAWLAGAVSVGQVQEIVEAEAETPGAESVLLGVAEAADLSRVRDRAREHRQATLDAVELRARQVRRRRFRHWVDRDGMVCFEGALPPERGIPVVNRIRSVTERAWRKAKADPDRRGRPERFDAYAADAFVELVTVPSDRQGGGTGPAGRPEVVFVCDLHAYRRGHPHSGEVCHIIGGGPVPVAVVRDFAADGFVKAVLHDGTRIVAVKHFGRHLPAPLRTALDLGPVPAFTGRECVDCGRRYGLEYDHVDPVAHHGPTAYDNLVARCWPDHQAKTARDRRAGLLGPHPPQPVAPR